jgi:predicted lipid-binding transport protein (Tim44 family)
MSSVEGQTMLRLRLIALPLALLGLFALVAADAADARVGSGRSYGSRGSNTYSSPPSTNTAPKAAPVERSMTQKGAPSAAQSQSGASAATASRFGGWRGLLMGGLIAAALGSIFGFGALASVLGFLLQLALIAGVVYLVVMFIRSRSQPALARATPQSAARAPAQPDVLQRHGMAGSGDAHGKSALTVGQEDLDTFERLLGDIQAAYGRSDTRKLEAMTTPEMLSYLSQELADNAKQGVRNELSSVKLLQGDVAEAWRENGSDYATVAMRFSLVDAVVDEATGRVVSGDRSQPTEATEIWTFRRDDRAQAEGWQLSAIQQAA